MFDFYPTCLEKTKHVGIFTPRCYFPHMFGFWHICMGKGTHVWKKPHNYMFANVCHFPHMCGKSHWHAYFRLSYLWKIANRQRHQTSHPSLHNFQELDSPVATAAFLVSQYSRLVRVRWFSRRQGIVSVFTITHRSGSFWWSCHQEPEPTQAKTGWPLV